ncbi:MAG: diaminopimelate decarboxylase [Acidobacteria bacterium]|nr:diaminopimelate decarboxylase [Acidobacteriota bacterium]MBW4044829.1 diaminopimelate decarboxylase [Acidobacteriota bacterium]
MTPARPFVYPIPGSSLHCGKMPLEKLAKRFKTPLYVYSADQIVERFELFSHAFEEIPHLICYSVKANSALGILRLLDKQGAGFDIVSGGELERVLRINRKAAERVVFSGVGKTAPEMDLALKAGIRIFNVESAGELELLSERARRVRRTARIALRVNPDVFAETHPYISTGLREHKFGIDIREARAVYQRARRLPGIQPCGISVHIGSQIRSATPFADAAARVVALAEELRADGIKIDSIDVGGGLGIEYTAGAKFNAKAQAEEYARQLIAALAPLKDITLLLEPGRFLVAQAGALLTRVLYVKKNGEKTFVVTDAAMNDLVRPALYQAHHEILPVVRRQGSRQIAVDVVGPVCESGDFFARDRLLPTAREGDLLAILDAGAYGLSLSSNYNTRMRPAEVLVKGATAKLIRRRETIGDLLAPELSALNIRS